MDPVSTINEQNEKTERQAMEGLEDVNRESQKTARDIGKRFSGSIAGLGKDMLRAIKRSRDESIERRKAQKAQRKAYSSGMLGVAANQITKGANATAGAVKGYLPSGGSDMTLLITFILHFVMVFGTGVNPSDSVFFSTNIVIGFFVYFLVVKRPGESFNGYEFAKTMAYAVFVIYAFYLFSFLANFTNNYGGVAFFRALLNPVMHPLWTYYILSKRDTPFSSKISVGILFFWTIWFLVLWAQMQDATMYESVISADNVITARQMIADVGTFLKEAMFNVGKLPGLMTNFTDRSIAHATGGLYVGQVEQNKKGPLGVYLGGLEGADPEFYTDDPVTVWATLTGQSLMENPVNINVTCNSSNQKYLGQYESRGLVYPAGNFEFHGLLEEYLDCRFNQSQLRSGTNRITFFASFNFDTMSYLKTYFIDRERLREMTRSGIDPLDGYSDKNPLAVYTSGPIAIGMGTNTPPIAVEQDAVKPKLGITIENRWKGRLKEINQMLIQTPEHITIEDGDCDQTHPFIPFEDSDPEYNTYQLTDYGKSRLSGIEGYSQPIKCRLTIHPDILGSTPVTTKYIRVNLSYVYEIYDSLDINVKFRQDKEEQSTQAYTKYFSDCKITADAVYDSAQGQNIVSKAKDIESENPPYIPFGYTSSGYDSSGFIWAVMKEVGICGFTEQRSARDISPTVLDYTRAGKVIIPNGKPFTESELKPGDVLFFDLKEQWGVPDHAAIYIGDGQIIDSRDYEVARTLEGGFTNEGGVLQRPISDIRLGGLEPKDYRQLFYQANRFAYSRPPLCKNKGSSTMPRLDTAITLEASHIELYDSNGRDGAAENFRNYINNFANANDISSPLLAALLSKVSGFGTELEVKYPGGIGVAGCKDVTIFEDIEQIRCAAETLSMGYDGKTRSGTKSDTMAECKEHFGTNEESRWRCVISNYPGFDETFASEVWGLYTHWFDHICLAGQGTVADFGNDVFSASFVRSAGQRVESKDLADMFAFSIDSIDSESDTAMITQEFSSGSAPLSVGIIGWYWTNPFYRFNMVSIDDMNVTIQVYIRGYAAKTLNLREDNKATVWQSFIAAEYDPPPLSDPASISGSHDIHISDSQGKDVCTMTFTEINEMIECGIPGFRAKVLRSYEGEETFNNDYVSVQFFYDPKVT